MTRRNRRTCVSSGALCALLFAMWAPPARADEIWVAPTAQQDLGGLGIGSNTFWPATIVGAVRLAWGVPDNLKTLQSAKVVLIPHSPGGPSTLNLLVCAAKSGDAALANCAAPSSKPFVGVANQLVEVEVAGILAPYIGFPGANYLAVIAYTTPTTATDHIVGLRFGYEPIIDSGVATLDKNTFSGTQTAPAFVGDGSGLTNLPFPAGAATLGANTFAGTQTAPAFAGSGAALTGVAKLGANTFTGTQTIGAGNLALDFSTATTGMLTKAGAPFLHNFGTSNTFLGMSAGNLAMTGASNTGVGEYALSENTTGRQNAAFGMAALGENRTGRWNTAAGANALTFNFSGEANTAAGFEALYSNATGDRNTASGASALRSNSTGNANTAAGASALLKNTGGGGNTAAGTSALQNNVTGNDNTAFGIEAGFQATGSNNVYLGAYLWGTAGESNAMYLGNGQTKTVISGIRGTTTGAANAIPVVIDSNGQLGTISSSIRFKEDIHDMADVSGRLMKLRPVTFRYTQAYSDGAKPIQYGLIAEEVAEVFPELAVRRADGQVETVHYETLNVLLLNELQKQALRFEALEQQMNEMRELLRERGAGR